MLKIPLSDIIAKITQEAKISEEEINNRIKAKLDQLSGLISKEGAAHIVANELGVKLLEQTSGKLQIKNILAGMRDVETTGKVQQVFPLREFKTDNREGKVASFVVGDETGTIRVVLWGNQADQIANIQPGGIVKVLGGYVRENTGRKEIHMNDRSKLVLDPKGETIGDVKTETVQRKTIKDLTESDSNVEVLATVVQIFDPRFFEVCPECGKRIRGQDGLFSCLQHGNVKPDYSYVCNLFLDDGTENIRGVFFRNQMAHLIGKAHADILAFRESPDLFQDMKNQLLGTIVKVTGRVTKNTMFDRLELMAQTVDPNPSAEDELQRIQPSS